MILKNRCSQKACTQQKKENKRERKDRKKRRKTEKTRDKQKEYNKFLQRSSKKLDEREGC